MIDIGFAQVRAPGGPSRTEPGPRQKQVRLSDEEQAELVARREVGAFKKELARAYGIHVETVRAIIKRQAAALPES